MTNYSDNCFLFLGKTGVGKSLCAKNLTSNKNIIISDGKDSCTGKACGYDAFIPSSLFSKGLKYRVIDTPGLNDSFGRDKIIGEEIKNFLKDEKVKIKGIFIFLNFRDVRFDNAEKDVIKKIYNLVPLDNFWEYVTIIFTNYLAGKFENLEEKRKRTDKSFRNSFKELIDKAFEEETIIKIDVNDLRIKYIDLYDPDKFDPETRENVIRENKVYLDSLKKLFIQLSKNDPLYGKLDKKMEYEKKVISKNPYDNKAKLFSCTIEKFCYYNHEGKLVKQIPRIKDKQYVKEIELNRLKAHSDRAFFTSIGAYIATAACAVGSIVFPPAAPALIAAGTVCYASGVSATAVQIGTTISDAVENHTYNNADDISKYEN